MMGFIEGDDGRENVEMKVRHKVYFYRKEGKLGWAICWKCGDFFIACCKNDTDFLRLLRIYLTQWGGA